MPTSSRHFRLIFNIVKTFTFFLSVNHALDVCWSLSEGSPARDPPIHALHEVGDIVFYRNFVLDHRSSCVSSRTDVQGWRSCFFHPRNIIFCEERVDKITFLFLAKETNEKYRLPLVVGLFIKIGKLLTTVSKHPVMVCALKVMETAQRGLRTITPSIAFFISGSVRVLRTTISSTVHICINLSRIIFGNVLSNVA
jgi:hypothetical protein